MVSAVFNYLDPALAVLLFAHVAAVGVMWLPIATAAVVFAVWRRPWRLARRANRRQQARLAVLGGVLAGMNTLFYLAIARLPLATARAIEFLGTIVLAAMVVAAAVAVPADLGPAWPAFTHPAWLAWGAGIGICSSVILYVTAQLAMAALPRASFAPMLALLPAFAALTGAVVLGQIPTARDLAGIALVIAGVAAHRPNTRAAGVAPDGHRGTGRTRA